MKQRGPFVGRRKAFSLRVDTAAVNVGVNAKQGSVARTRYARNENCQLLRTTSRVAFEA